MTQGKGFFDKFGAVSPSIIEKFLSIDEIAYMPIKKLFASVNEN
jgi:hypothetical protein